MNKKVGLFLIAILLFPVSANASYLNNKSLNQPTVVILDTAIDKSIPAFKNKIIYEACITQWASCLNQMSEMEGPGSATLPKKFISKNGFDHGTQITSLAIATNPNINIIFIRIIGMNLDGSRQSAGESTVYNALDWILKNKNKFNIQAISMSQSHHGVGPAGTDYCPKTPTTELKIKQLLDEGIPFFVPAGNDGDYRRIDWPSCIPSTISIGSANNNNSIASYSNYDFNLIDFYAKGELIATTVGNKKISVSGTSTSTIVAATQWATVKFKNPQMSYLEVYDLLSRTSTPINNKEVANGKLINLQGALNG